LTLEKDDHESARFSVAANQAVDMAYRADRALTDPSWWEICGLPDWNERMDRIRVALEEKLKKSQGRR